MSAAPTLPIDSALRVRLEAAATKRGTTPEALAEFAVLDFLAADEAELPPLADWQREQIEEGIAAADRGEFASHEEVERVFAKYRT